MGKDWSSKWILNSRARVDSRVRVDDYSYGIPVIVRLIPSLLLKLIPSSAAFYWVF